MTAQAKAASFAPGGAGMLQLRLSVYLGIISLVSYAIGLLLHYG